MMSLPMQTGCSPEGISDHPPQPDREGRAREAAEAAAMDREMAARMRLAATGERP